MQNAKELVHFGGFLDCEYLRRTLAKEFQLMESRYFFLPSIYNRCFYDRDGKYIQHSTGQCELVW
jgi:hypothetical protein